MATINRPLLIMARDVRVFAYFLNRLRDPQDLALNSLVPEESTPFRYLVRPTEIKPMRDAAVIELTGPLGNKSIADYQEIRKEIIYKRIPFYQVSDNITREELEKIIHEINQA